LNTIIWSNTAPVSPDIGPDGSYNYCCSSTLSVNDFNIPLDPNFIDLAGGDYRLRSGSPCIDAGSSAVKTVVDYSGITRPVDGDGDNLLIYDIGAYERKLDSGHTTVNVTISGRPRGQSSAWTLDYGSHQITTGKAVIITVPQIEETTGTRYINLGWEGTGSTPVSGTNNCVFMTVTENSSLNWIWQCRH